MKGLVIKFDGVDGAGKTELIELVRRHFSRTHRVAVTMEFRSPHDLRPPDDHVSEYLHALVNRSGVDLLECQLAMMLASRRNNVYVVPRLQAGNDLVLCDRSELSTIAYGAALGEVFGAFAEWVARRPPRHKVFWMDVDPEVAYQRSVRKKASPTLWGDLILDRVEEQGVGFQRRVDGILRALAARWESQVERIDGTGSQEDVLGRAIARIEALLVGVSF